LKERFLDLGGKIGSGFVSPRERRERYQNENIVTCKTMLKKKKKLN
jgi:hypothetical protein